MLDRIARKFGGATSAVAELNDLAAPYRLEVGQVLTKGRMHTRRQQMGMRIILASDEPVVPWLMTDLLEDEGLAVTAALDGRQTLESVEREPPDFLILDLSMPMVDGREIVRVLYERELMRFPILVFTGSAD